MSNRLSISKESDPTKVVENQGVRLIKDEIVLILRSGATLGDVLMAANSVGGRITGFLPNLEMAKIEVIVANTDDLKNKISLIKSLNLPSIIDAMPNALLDLVH